jgi:N-acyl-D-amino-acid deacylase
MAGMVTRLLLLVSLIVLGGCQPTPPPTTPPPPQAAMPRYDLVIRNGSIVDGTGAPAYAGDVAITDGNFAAVGAIPTGAGSSELDASGLVVAPGFIDVHTHVDRDIHRLPQAENFVRDGVTTIVSGNCGSSVEDVRQYFDRIRKNGRTGRR